MRPFDLSAAADKTNAPLLPAQGRVEAHGVFSFSLYSVLQCQSIIETANRLNAWQTAELSLTDDAGVSTDFISLETRSAAILDTGIAAPLYQAFEGTVDRALGGLMQRIWGARFSEQWGTQLVRYQPGGHYIAHTDSSSSGEDARRYFTVLCYLNDSFFGGQTSFPSLNYSSIPKTGKAVVFPSGYVHCAKPVLKGQKYILITWLCGSAPIRWI